MLITSGAIVLGLLIGMVVGGLGGGGAVLTVPVLVYLLGSNAQDATTSSLVIVGSTAVIGTLDHARSHGIRWRTGLVFGLVGIGAAFAGTRLNRLVTEPVLLLAFAAVMVLAGVAMLLGDRSPDQSDEPAEPAGPGASTGVLTSTVTTARMRTALLVVVAGAGVGFLIGFLGVGGGFMIVPALVLLLGIPMSAAVGTSLLIIGINSVAALIFRFGAPGIDWGLTVPFALAAVLGTLAGRRVADRLSATVLTRAFAVLLLVVAAFVGVQNALRLW